MSTRLRPGGPRAGTSWVRSSPAMMLAVAVLSVASVTGVATAKEKPKPAKPTLEIARVTVLGKAEAIVVDARGVTVYTYSGETAHHLLCTPTAGTGALKGLCLKSWPPVTVRSSKTKPTAAKGIEGKLGILHRDGFFQVTLGGCPLYYWNGDKSKKGLATGDGITEYGHTWQVVKATPSKATAAA